MLINIGDVISKINGLVVDRKDVRDEIIAAFEDSLEVIISRQTDGVYQVYENHPDADIITVKLEELGDNEVKNYCGIGGRCNAGTSRLNREKVWNINSY